MKKIFMLLCSLIPLISCAQQKEVVTANFEQMLQEYRAGNLSDHGLLALSLAMEGKERDSVARAIASAYKSRVLSKGDYQQLINPKLKKFLSLYPLIFQTKDSLIRFIIKNPNVADKNFEESGFSVRLIDFIVENEFILPETQPNGISTGKAPDWALLENRIAKQTGLISAHRLVLDAKLKWSEVKTDWPNIAKFQIEKIELNGIDTAGAGRSKLNNMVYEVIFMHCDDQAILSKGIEYMKSLLTFSPNADTWIDTYSNLLYKVGKKRQALTQQRRALAISMEKKDNGRIQEYQNVIDKMLNNQPTWNTTIQ